MSERPERMLSYSSIMTLMSCQQKYWHRKIAKTPVDSDHTQGDALAVGKCFHQILEDCLHDLEGMDLEATVWTAMQAHSVKDEWHPRLCAMVRTYDEMHQNSGLEVLFCEMELIEENFLGYIDAVMVDKQGVWWIVDLKTAARYDSNLQQTLPYDMQMSLYSQRFRRVAANLDLDPNKFGGCRYRVTTKPYPAKRKTGETDTEYILRLADKTVATDVVIPAGTLAHFWLDTNQIFDHTVKVAKELKEGKTKPMRNFGYCMSYFKPCEYWSKCHTNKLFSEKTEVIYKDADTHYEAKKLEEIL